jgi:hypothetical protein
MIAMKEPPSVKEKQELKMAGIRQAGYPKKPR